MEQSKYYLPDISDFYVGYEYEYKTHDGAVHTKEYMDSLPWKKSHAHDWVDITAYINRSLTGRMQTDLDIDCIRTKYLCKECIESLGWVYTANNHYELKEKSEYGGPDETWLLTHYNKTISIEKEDSHRSYDGECKSINELKTLMKWMKIN